jgi:hypothetical protein
MCSFSSVQWAVIVACRSAASNQWTAGDAVSVDVPEDVVKVEGLLRAASAGEKRDSSLRLPAAGRLGTTEFGRKMD